mgnify:CR=1 FL=1
MRLSLSDYSGRYIKVVATFTKLGSTQKGGYKNKVLLKNIILAETGEYLTDHLWMTFNNIMKKQNLMSGDRIFIIAKVKLYKKGYTGKKFNAILNTNGISFDYHLDDTKMVIKQKDFLENIDNLHNLIKRKQSLSEAKEKNCKIKMHALNLIDVAENEKKQFRGN